MAVAPVFSTNAAAAIRLPQLGRPQRTKCRPLYLARTRTTTSRRTRPSPSNPPIQGPLSNPACSQLIPLFSPAPGRHSGCRFGLGFVRGELALVAGLQLAVGDAADAAYATPVEIGVYPAGHGALVVVDDLNAAGELFCAGAGGQHQEAEGEAGHGVTTRRPHQHDGPSSVS